MSNYMINDSNAINDWNPFVVGDFNLPGTWSAAWPYSRVNVVKDPVEEAMEPSPACSYGITSAMGSFLRGGSFCGLQKEPIISCPMSRPLVPEQLYDEGRWTLYPKSKTQKQTDVTIPICMILLLLIVVFALRPRIV